MRKTTRIYYRLSKTTENIIQIRDPENQRITITGSKLGKRLIVDILTLEYILSYYCTFAKVMIDDLNNTLLTTMHVRYLKVILMAFLLITNNIRQFYSMSYVMKWNYFAKNVEKLSKLLKFLSKYDQK